MEMKIDSDIVGQLDSVSSESLASGFDKKVLARALNIFNRDSGSLIKITIFCLGR